MSWAAAVRRGEIVTTRSIPVVADVVTPPLTPLLANGQAYTDQDRGIFICLGMSTFAGVEFIDPSAWPIDLFNPTGYDPDQWAQVAVDFNCKYAIFTIKFLDGFCLWPTTTTTYGIDHTAWYAANGSPDLTQLYINAFRARGVLPCYYFSIGDKMWTFDHPPGPGDPTVKAQFKAYTEAQITEVLTRYGQIAAIWLDSTFVWHGDATPWASAAERNAFIKSVDPGVIIVDNSQRHLISESDVIEFESAIAPPGDNTEPGEHCFSITGPDAWFWKSDDHGMFEVGQIAGFITHDNSANCAALVGVPPNTAGIIPAQFIAQLDKTKMYLGEIPRVSPNNMTANNLPSPYVASASSEYTAGPSFEAYKAFNPSLDTFWGSAAGALPAWIQIDLGSAQTVGTYMMQARKGFTANQWLAWTLAGSPNGSSWTTVDTRSQGVVTPGTVQFFDLSSPQTYRYWRWTITSSNTGTDADCAQLALFP